VAGASEPGAGRTVDDTAVLIAYTVLGDANLDSRVNGQDFALLAGHFGRTNQTWHDGDFNYDGSVNGSEFALLAQNFGRQSQTGPGLSVTTAVEWAALDSFGRQIGVVVPEPSLAGFAALAGIYGLLRRRRHG
jgi:hypothetical protein